jgi:pimeloyl-ACP methyl ester carboxylesterase
MSTAPIVLVHGNPETPAIWSELIPHLGDRQVLTPRLPGFGSEPPAAFGATMGEYVDWLIGELEAIGEPVDLVGHDWGGGLVIPVACQRPDLIRTWASDVFGLFAPDYLWHDMAQVWQTPSAGEEAIAAMTGLPVGDRVAVFESLSMPPAVAADVAAALTPTMGRCILALYRSAAQPTLADYSAAHLAKAVVKPGLCIAPTEDPYTGGLEKAATAAAIAGARVVELAGLGHWWMLQDPAKCAEVLRDFWATNG